MLSFVQVAGLWDPSLPILMKNAKVKRGINVKRFLKKAGIYVAIIGIFSAIIILFVFRIIRSRTNTGGTSDIDQHIDGIQSGIAEAAELNEDAQQLAENAKNEIDDSTELNQQVADELNTAGGSIDRLTEASNQLAGLVHRLQERAREENT